MSSELSRTEAARIAGQIYSGQGAKLDGHHLYALMVVIDTFIDEGVEAGAAALGWEVKKRNADVVALDLVRGLSEETPKPQDR